MIFFHSFVKKINQQITYLPIFGFSDHEIGPKNRRITNLFYEFMRMHYKWRNFQEANWVPRQPQLEIFNANPEYCILFGSCGAPRGEECQLLPPGWTTVPKRLRYSKIWHCQSRLKCQGTHESLIMVPPLYFTRKIISISDF